LEPLGHQHASELLAAAQYDDIWTYLDEPTPRAIDDITAFINDALADRDHGSRLPFAIVDVASAVAVGSSSFIDIREADRGVEIGWTWMTPRVWGTGLNLEAKYLLLQHAFDDQGAIRVALKTDSRNTRSQKAIEALGAVREGIWRNHRILSTGRYRDSVYYSIIDSEWPAARDALRARLSRSRQ
jgi:RimJ/RimL family protein N-acetyltransferase